MGNAFVFGHGRGGKATRMVFLSKEFSKKIRFYPQPFYEDSNNIFFQLRLLFRLVILGLFLRNQ